MWILIFTVLSGIMNWKFDYENGYELLVGTIVVALISNIINYIVFRRAWKLTGDLKRYGMIDSSEMSSTHWKLRSMFILFFVILSISPLGKIIVSPLTHQCYLYVYDKWMDFYQSLMNALAGTFFVHR